MISKCNNPRNPHLNPNPNATDVSASNCSAASFNCNFSNASLKYGYFAPSVGYSPQYTIGFTFLYPGSGSAHGSSASVIVSPTLVPCTFLRLAVTYPTIPAVSSSHGLNLPAPNVPTSTTSALSPVAIIFIFVPTLIVPSLILVKMITPLYASYILSKINPCNGAFLSPSGDGIFSTICFNTCSTFSPLFAEI